MGRYHVWNDSESVVQSADEWFDNLDDACDYACDFVHRYDGKPFRVICHVEDGDITVETYENSL